LLKQVAAQRKEFTFLDSNVMLSKAKHLTYAR